MAILIILIGMIILCVISSIKADYVADYLSQRYDKFKSMDIGQLSNKVKVISNRFVALFFGILAILVLFTPMYDKYLIPSSKNRVVSIALDILLVASAAIILIARTYSIKRAASSQSSRQNTGKGFYKSMTKFEKILFYSLLIIFLAFIVLTVIS